MTPVDFYSLKIDQENKTDTFKEELLDLLDKMLNEAGIIDPQKLQKLAQLRAKVDISLSDF